MAQSDKKAVELSQFRAFQAAFPYLPTGAVSQPDPPEPDIALESSEGLIAVELTELHPAGSVPRRSEAEQASIVSRAASKYQDLGGPPVLVQVYWASTHISNRADRHFSDLLAERVFGAVPPINGEAILDRSSQATALWTHPEIDRVWVFRPEGLTDTVWECPQSGSPVSIGVAPIQWELDRNTDKPAKYLNSYVSHWIVLVAEAAGPSTWVHIPEALSQYPFTTPFDRAFLVDRMFGRNHELFVHRSPSASA